MKCCATCKRDSCIWVNATHQRWGCDLWEPDAVTKAVMFTDELRRQGRWYRKIWRFVNRLLQAQTEEESVRAPAQRGEG